MNFGVFGDIDIDAHREWEERVCSLAGITPYLPLWKQARLGLLDELFQAGFRATIIAVKDGVLDNRFLGRTPDINAVREMEKAGVDPSGEGGEYHTVVTSGPIFSSPVRLEKKKPVLRDGYWFLEVSVSLV